jgi:hypothetical protein
MDDDGDALAGFRDPAREMAEDDRLSGAGRCNVTNAPMPVLEQRPYIRDVLDLVAT